MFKNVRHHQSAHQFGKWQFRNANLLKNNLLAAALRRQNHAIVGIMRGRFGLRTSWTLWSLTVEIQTVLNGNCFNPEMRWLTEKLQKASDHRIIKVYDIGVQ